MRKLPQVLATALCLSAFASCSTVSGPPQASASINFANAYLFRGVPQIDANVMQSDLSVALPYEDGSTASLTVWGNMDLESDNGSAAFGGGNSGTFTEIDIVPEYAWTIGDLSAAVGLISYSFPSGTSGITGTSEFYASIGGDVLGLDGALTAYYDLEEVEGLYVSGSLGRGFELAERVSLDLSIALGYADDDQAMAYYGSTSGGLADLLFSAGLGYAVDEHMSVGLGLFASSILGSDLEDAVDAAGYDTDSVWLALGASWSY
ncbi:Bacterial protein of unknown function (Gcw_chp) [Planctomycetes bacterium Pla163]|uniref:MltA-interacting protein MipA n=1 Tax=Rohdeia mirabilis TaxID=2528008 RepID=A0A518CVT8_9BACT|nr:Bacterial protein of unknown function (Gcw_chp) [Planctomycetes bacterium Pla163]